MPISTLQINIPPMPTCSFAALSTPVMVPPALPAAYASSMLGYFSWSGCLKVRLLALEKSSRGQVASPTEMRSGQDMVYMMGRRMSGQPNCSAHNGQNHWSELLVVKHTGQTYQSNMLVNTKNPYRSIC